MLIYTQDYTPLIKADELILSAIYALGNGNVNEIEKQLNEVRDIIGNYITEDNMRIDKKAVLGWVRSDDAQREFTHAYFDFEVCKMTITAEMASLQDKFKKTLENMHASFRQ